MIDQVNTIVADVMTKMDSIAEKQNLIANSFEQRFATLETSMALLSGEQRAVSNDIVPQIRNLEVSYAKVAQQLEKEKEAQELLATDAAFTRELLANDVAFKLKTLEAHVEEFGSQMFRPHLEALTCSLENEARHSYNAAISHARSSGELAEMRKWITSEIDTLKADFDSKYFTCKTELAACREDQHRCQLNCEASADRLKGMVSVADNSQSEPHQLLDCKPHGYVPVSDNAS